MQKIVVNQPEQDVQVLTTLLDEMENAQAFELSVAFFNLQGIQLIKTVLSDLNDRGVKGRLLTGVMNGFNQKAAFVELLKIPNLEVRVVEEVNLHQKLYLFKKDATSWTLLSGSSNLTESAMKKNSEFNTLVAMQEDEERFKETHDFFEASWSKATPLTQDWIETYTPKQMVSISKERYDKLTGKANITISDQRTNYATVRPNIMQEAALKQIQISRDKGENRGLLISATGTGKTYLSAFDVSRFKPKRLLFLAHRETLLNQAKDTFARVIPTATGGIVSGTRKELSADYLFATVQTVSQNLEWFRPDSFDYIVIDESHHSGGATYQAILDYFNPSWLLGMTATPERMDDYDIFELFNHNVVYEIRLQDALEADLLVPFNYFGVEETLLDATRDIGKLTEDSRLDNIKRKIDYYCPTEEQPKGIVFTSSVDEARLLADKFSEMGAPSASLYGGSNQFERELTIRKLEEGELHYIFVRDLFNEGIDIPSVNRIIMLRQTESSIIFIQQLGRGLRKYEGKEAVTVLDFIGNYANNYMIPLALTGDNSGDKERLKGNVIPKSTKFNVGFEKIPRERVFASIKTAQLNSARDLKQSYTYLKRKLGRIPKLADFILDNQKDPYRIALYRRDYVRFLEWMKEDVPVLDETQHKILHFLSKQVMKGVRLAEIDILDRLLRAETVDASRFNKTYQSAVTVLDLSFFNQQDYKSYGQTPLVEIVDGNVRFTSTFSSFLRDDFYRNQVQDIIQTAKLRNKQYRASNQLQVGKTYSYTDVCRLLNWEKDERATINGYRTKFGTTPIFVNLDKDEDAIQYADKLIDREHFFWHSRSRITTDSGEIRSIIDGQNVSHLLVRRKDAESATDFTYLGQVTPVNYENGYLDGNSIVEMNFKFEEPIEKTLYDYLTADFS
jgi:superfamily II DNA or RNA helicase/HKD family nuclease